MSLKCSQQYPSITPSHSYESTPSITSLLLFVFAEIGATSTASGRLEVNLFLFEKRVGKSHFGTPLNIS